VNLRYNGNHPQDIARREGFRSGAVCSAWVVAAIAVVVMIGLHMALSMRSDAIHESALATIKQADALLLTDCRKDLARYSDIAALERDAVAAMERRR
jgi:hypothetical protein